MLVRANEKKIAINLRKQGHSFSEILKKVRVSRSSLSHWLRDIPLSSLAQQRLDHLVEESLQRASRMRKEYSARQIDNYLQDARIDLRDFILNVKTARLLAALLYHCEGEKTLSSGIRFTNSDPELLSVFLTLLRHGFRLNEKKFRICVHLHSYHNQRKILSFWSSVSGVPLNQFIKPYRKSNTGKTKKKGYNGCVSLRYHDAGIGKQLLVLFNAFAEKYGPIG